MSNFDPNVKYINGPVNVARLEGYVHNIKKVIYLFMDMHADVHRQTGCDNFFSEDVTRYFTMSFYKLNKGTKIYDFFMEIRPSEELAVKGDKYRFRSIYIEQMMKFFKTLFRIDEKTNKVQTPDIFKKVRFHYMDVRDYLAFHIWYNVRDVQELLYHILIRNYAFYERTIKNSVEMLSSSNEHLTFLTNLLTMENYKEPNEKVSLIKPKDMYEVDKKALFRLIYKIREKYNDEKIKNIMNRQINVLVNKLSNLEKYINETNKEYMEYANTIPKMIEILSRDEKHPELYTYGMSSYTKRKLINNILDRIDYISDNLMISIARLTDIYFLRRFLDKDYITNAIVYTGMLHSMYYIKILVNNFDFKVTHLAYSRIKDTNEFTEKVKFYQDERELLLFLLPDTLYQCSNISHFPEKFE
ncbi:MAG: hypothetical protein QXW79_01585 [Thermoplasmata archaeon]